MSTVPSAVCYIFITHLIEIISLLAEKIYSVVGVQEWKSLI